MVKNFIAQILLKTLNQFFIRIVLIKIYLKKKNFKIFTQNIESFFNKVLP